MKQNKTLIKQLVRYSIDPAWGFGTLTIVIIIVMHIYKYCVYKLQYQGPVKAWAQTVAEVHCRNDFSCKCNKSTRCNHWGYPKKAGGAEENLSMMCCATVFAHFHNSNQKKISFLIFKIGICSWILQLSTIFHLLLFWFPFIFQALSGEFAKKKRKKKSFCFFNVMECYSNIQDI